MDAFEETFWSGYALDDLFDRVSGRADNPLAFLFISAMRDWRRSAERGTRIAAQSVRERVEKVMSVTLHREMKDVSPYLGVLATVGSPAPFVGRFGTAWAIIHPFPSTALHTTTGTP